MRRWLRTALVAMLLLTGLQAGAHQQKEAITRVLFNPRTGNIEVMHRFLLHDAEHAIKVLRHSEADILGSPDDREFFSDYVHLRFAMTDQDGDTLPLNPVGNEIENRFLWVYAETPIPENLASLTFSHDAMRDLWPEYVNMVNVERNGTVQTATFIAGNREMTIEFAGQ